MTQRYVIYDQFNNGKIIAISTDPDDFPDNLNIEIDNSLANSFIRGDLSIANSHVDLLSKELRENQVENNFSYTQFEQFRRANDETDPDVMFTIDRFENAITVTIKQNIIDHMALHDITVGLSFIIHTPNSYDHEYTFSALDLVDRSYTIRYRYAYKVKSIFVKSFLRSHGTTII